MISFRAVLLSCLLSGSSAFVVPTQTSVTSTKLHSAVGGWGIGQSRELTDAEMAKGERSAFDGYQLRERGEFLRSIQEDRAQMAKDEMSELLGVAKMAGLDVKDPSERLNKFEEDLLEDVEDDLDLTVQWEEEDVDAKADTESITRMDDDTGAPGVW